MHRRIKGLRLVTAFGIASMLGTMGDITHGLPGGASLNVLAGGFGLWASVSEGRATRAGSSRDLLLLSLAAVLGAMSFILLAPPLGLMGRVAPELVLASGAFFVGYLRRFGLTGTGFGSQNLYRPAPRLQHSSDHGRRVHRRHGRADCRTGLDRAACLERTCRTSSAGSRADVAPSRLAAS
jgi:hypothetical protein